MTGYKALLNKSDAVPSQITNDNLIHAMAGIVEALMIRRIGDFNWFYGPIIKLPEHRQTVIIYQFLPAVLVKMKNRLKQLLGRAKPANQQPVQPESERRPFKKI